MKKLIEIFMSLLIVVSQQSAMVQPNITTIPEQFQEQDSVEITEEEISTPDEVIAETAIIEEIKKPVIRKSGSKTLKVYDSDYVIPENLTNDLYNIINNYPALDIGIYAISLKDYTCIGYNESFSIDTASSVKGPFSLYVMKEIANGNHTLDEKIEYTKEFYLGGSGTVQYSPFGTIFTVEDLLNRMINCSDNIAFLLLQNHFGYEGYNEMISALGCNIWLNGWTKWGKFTPEELAIIWNEIYEFSKETDEGKYLLDLLINAKYNFIKSSLGNYTKVAHKSGFNPRAYNDAAIVFTESDISINTQVANDYILVIMTSPGNSGYNSQCLKRIANTMDLIMRDLATYQNETAQY